MSKGSSERALGVGSAHVEGYVPKHYLPVVLFYVMLILCMLELNLTEPRLNMALLRQIY